MLTSGPVTDETKTIRPWPLALERRQRGPRHGERDPQVPGDAPVPLGLVHLADRARLLGRADGDHAGVVDEDVEAAAVRGEDLAPTSAAAAPGAIRSRDVARRLHALGRQLGDSIVDPVGRRGDRDVGPGATERARRREPDPGRASGAGDQRHATVEAHRPLSLAHRRGTSAVSDRGRRNPRAAEDAC